MSMPSDDFPETPEAKRVRALWEGAALPVDAPSEQASGLALGFRVNFRVNLLKAFQAAWETTRLAISATKVAHAPFDPVGWLEVGAELVSAVEAIFASLVQRMRPIDYVACVVLSNHDDGLQPDGLRAEIERFLADPEPFQFAWYLGMSGELVRRAREVIAGSRWFEQVLEQLRKADFLKEEQGKLWFKPRNFTVGWSAEA
jgi:hypothetical protein